MKRCTGAKVAGPEVQQGKTVVTYGRHREKPGASQQAASERVVVENNHLSHGTGMSSYGAAVQSWGQYAVNNNLSPEQTQAGLNKLAKGDMPEGANIPKAIVDAYTDGVLAAGALYLGPAATAAKVTMGALIAGIANGTYQWFDLSQPGNENKAYDYLGTGAAAVMGGLAPGRGVCQNVGIASGGAVFTDGANAGAVGGAAVGGVIGGGIGKYAPDLLDPVFGSSAGFWSDIGSSYVSEATSSAVKDAINKREPNK
ncbi:adhesin [Erwinia aphidicola]|uniref:adhesin n=1 Tax=Erwinia aphidicola TaxID=68334 RepID=UPI00300C57ED